MRRLLAWGVAAVVCASGLSLATGCGGGSDSAFFPDGGAGAPAGGTGGRGGSGGSGGVGGHTDGGGGGSGGSAATGGTGGGTGGTGGSSGCTSAGQCDDGIACTSDYCVGGSCTHAPGAAACPAGQYCDAATGCVPSPACATTAQCEQQFSSDACKVNIACDAASATCTFDVLDKDADNHPPIVCGGDDCDDSDAARHPGQAETCDGKDNDCNGSIDDGATCSGNASCQCGGSCIDLTNDPAHCGACNNACPTGGSCVSSACSCPSGTTDCGSVCANTQTSSEHCGACNNKCPSGSSCTAGKCGSPVMLILADRSGSMTTPIAGGTRWTELKSALLSFVQDSQTTGLFVGLQYFPLLNNSTSCIASDYSTLAVPFGPLPGPTSTGLVNSLTPTQATGLSLIVPALNGGIAATSTFPDPGASAKRAVVLLTDGSPNQCGVASDLIAAAQAGMANTPAVSTYVVQINTQDPPGFWNQVATAGGTGTAYDTGTTGQAAILAALVDIRTKLLAP